MTENYPPAPPPLSEPPPLHEPLPLSEPLPPPSEPLAPLPPTAEADQPGTADVVKNQAADLGQSGVDAGKHAVGVAQEQASQVAAEVSRQGQNLVHQAQEQLGSQAAQGQQQLATRLISLGDELGSMADGSGQPGLAADLARQAADRARGAGQWLDGRSPAQVLDDVQAFARRRPGVFVALALGAGLVAGRLTRGLVASQDGDSQEAAPATSFGGPPAASWPDPASEAGYPAPAPDAATYQPEEASEVGYPADPYGAGAGAASAGYLADPGMAAADDGSAVPVVDGLPATGGGSAWDVDPQADEQGTLGRHQAGSGGTL